MPVTVFTIPKGGRLERFVSSVYDITIVRGAGDIVHKARRTECIQAY
jgi:hypothetical protein